MRSTNDNDTDDTVARAEVHRTYGDSKYEFYLAFVLFVGSTMETTL